MRLAYLYSGEDGGAHLCDLVFPAGNESNDFSARVPGVLAAEVRQPPAFSAPFHNAPRRQLMIQLQGATEIDCGNGETCRIFPGEAVLADDLSGVGHMSREIAGPRVQLVIHLDRDVDLSPYLRSESTSEHRSRDAVGVAAGPEPDSSGSSPDGAARR